MSASVVNATMKPAAGIVGVVAFSFQGAWKMGQSTLGRKQEQQQRSTRVSDGVEAVKNSNHAQRADILQKFKDAKSGAKDRKQKYKVIAEEAMYGEQSSTDIKTPTSGDTSPISSESELAHVGPSPPPKLPSRKSLLRRHPSYSSPQSSSTQDMTDEDATFERDLEMAKQISLAEQRGYERGLANK